MINKKNIFFLLLLGKSIILSQNLDFELFIIDAFVAPEKPYTLDINFYTSEKAKCKIEIDNKYTINISKDFVEDHSAKIDFSNFTFSNKYVPYKIISELQNGKIIISETNELVLPYEEFIETKEGSDPVSTILFGMFLYFVPSPSMLFVSGENHFSLTKELPIVTFYSSGYNYPSGNISVEYTHVYEDNFDNVLRSGYKHFIPVPGIEYISPGITGFTNFNGFNGLGGEVSIGLFNIYDVFTVYTRVRYNSNLRKERSSFYEVTLGLYSHFFTIDL